MSWTDCEEPICSAAPERAEIETVIAPKQRDLGGFTVRRVLPSPARRLVGPFVFFDEMGPADFSAGSGIDVRPHPHIHIATVTYLFEGEILHRDSLGSEQVIQPGAVNWMTAGRGIAHSERTPPATRASAHRLHGIQLWVALPRSDEDSEPDFRHHPASTMPEHRGDEVDIRVLAGAAFGLRAPVDARSPLFYAEVVMRPASRLSLPTEYAERAAYVVGGAIRCGDETVGAGRMAVFSAAATTLHSDEGAHIMLLGGDPLDGERHLWWNFVSSSAERIEQAKRDWREGRFPRVPGDEEEFIPLPESA